MSTSIKNKRAALPFIAALFSLIVQNTFGQNLNKTRDYGSASFYSFKQAGPLNLNGRARAFLIDNQNPDIFYLGIVNGGILKSENKGISWRKLDTPDDLWISGLTQSPDGTLYAVTNSNFDNITKRRGAVYKSTNGESFEPTDSQPLEDEHSRHFNFIRAQTKNIIYAGTRSRLVVSQDGGKNWTATFNDPSCNPGFQLIQDMILLPDGSALISTGSAIYRSTDPTAPCSWNEVMKSPVASRRIVIDYCEHNPDYIYAAVYAPGIFAPGLEIYKSTDGGQNWQLNSPTLASSPFTAASLTGFMGVYSLSIAIDPVNCDVVYVGGQEVYKVSDMWTKIADGYRELPFGNNALQTAFQLQFDPENSNRLYVPGENGLFYIDDVKAQEPEVISLNFRTIGADVHTIEVDARGRIGSSTHSKGVFLIDPHKPADAGRTAEGILDVDGYDVKFSNLSKSVFVSHSHNRVYAYKENQAPQPFFPFIDQNNYIYAGINQAETMTNFDYWESANDSESVDSVTFRLDTVIKNLHTLQEHTLSVSGTLSTKQPHARLIPGTVSFINQNPNQTVTFRDYNQDGILYDDNVNKVGTLNYQTKEYEIEFFHTPANNSTLSIQYPFELNAGDTLFLNSPAQGLPINFALTSNLEPGDSVKIQDPYTSIFAMTYNDGIVLSREILRKGVPDYPADYIDLKHLPNTKDNPRNLHISKDGNHLYYTSDSRIHRISGLKKISLRNANQINDILTDESLGYYPGIKRIQLDPSGKNRMLVQIDNDELYEVTGILPGENTTSKILSAKLPDDIQQITCMVYDVNDPNTILLGTYEGLYITENANRREPDWTLNGGETDFLFIEDMAQVTCPSAEDDIYGNFYLATRGRGIWTTGSLGTFVPDYAKNESAQNSPGGLNVFPNPAQNRINIALPKGTKDFQGNIRIFDIGGRMVQENRQQHIAAHQRISINISTLTPGIYMMQAQDGHTVYNNRIVISR